MSKLKKILAGGLVVVSLMSLAACQSNDADKASAPVSLAVSSELESSGLDSAQTKNTDRAKTEEDKKDLVEGAMKSGQAKPGAKIETGVNKDGNATFGYTNPDGSGGGGVALD